MMDGSRLRSIALTVIEERPGSFSWVLLEGCPSFERKVATGEHLFGSFSEAVRDGAAVLMSMAGRSPAGPRIVEYERRPATFKRIALEQER